jgi:polyisoprenoid-binding protein YceI
VDEPELRAGAGFTSQPSETDVEGTRANMLDKVLEADKFPYALVRVTGVRGRSGSETLELALTLHGTVRTLHVPAKVEADAERVAASGRFAFDQTDFGMTPYSVLGGAVAVRDRVELRFDIRARRLPPPG